MVLVSARCEVIITEDFMQHPISPEDELIVNVIEEVPSSEPYQAIRLTMRRAIPLTVIR
jgi:hypothetical protein